MPEHQISSFVVPPGTMVTAQSFLIDRIKPDVELIALPEKTLPGGTMAWEIGVCEAKASRPSGLRGMLQKEPAVTAPEDRWIIDLRLNSPSNWAHFLNNHLPLVFALSDKAAIPFEKMLAVLPKDTPGYIQKAADLFGLEALTTDGTVKGQGLSFSVDPWVALRSARTRWAHLPAPRDALARILAEPSDQELPRRVFLSRQDTRILSNNAEIETVLAARGYQLVFPETLSPADQIRLFQNAEEIVAVHGAGLAPLLYCAPGSGPRQLIEILPCGHMTDVYRVVAAQLGVAWIGVRGRLKPEYVRPAYQIDQPPFTKYSLDAFEADPVSLEVAFDILADQGAR